MACGKCESHCRAVFVLDSQPSDADSVKVAEKFLCQGVWEQHLLNWIKGTEEMLRSYGEGSYDFKGEKARAKQSAGFSASKLTANKGIFCGVFWLGTDSIRLISISVLNVDFFY